jgi:hypothetical protein
MHIKMIYLDYECVESADHRVHISLIKRATAQHTNKHTLE